MRLGGAALWGLLVAGCDMVAGETVVDELRVISVRAAPPVLAPASGGRIEATVVDPDERVVEVLQWTCTPGGLGCLEAGTAEAPRALSSWTAVGEPEDEEVELTVGALTVDDTEDLPPATAWALACVPGACPILDEVRADPTPGSEPWQAAVSALSGFFDSLQDLPLRDTSAAFRVVPWVPLPDPSLAPPNPTITALDDVDSIRTGERQALRYAVDAEAPAVAFPLVSEGGFEEISSPVEDGEVAVTLVAGVPDEEGRGAIEPGTVLRIWLLIEDELGGAAIHKREVRVVE